MTYQKLYTQATTTASGQPPLTTMASFEAPGYMTDSSVGNGPMITISQPNGKKGIVVALPRLWPYYTQIPIPFSTLVLLDSSITL